MGGGGRRRRDECPERCFPFFLCALSGRSFAMGLVLFFCSFEQNPMGGLTGPPSIRAHLLLLYPFSASWFVESRARAPAGTNEQLWCARYSGTARARLSRFN